MPLKIRSYCVGVLLISGVAGIMAQTFSDLGIFSGSGLVVLPTAAIAPSSEFRIQYSRIDFLKPGYLGANVFGLSCGLSSSLETYVRVTGEQEGSISSQLGYTFGGKFTLPVDLPIVRHLALWTEATMSDADQKSGMFPAEAYRAAALATLDSNGIHPVLLAGVASNEGRSGLLFGAGATIALGHGVQAGLEFVDGYLENNSTQTIASIALRAFSNISLQLSPGYISASAGSTWTIVAGLSFTTAGIDFKPAAQEKKADEFILPSIEEIEKQSKEKHHD